MNLTGTIHCEDVPPQVFADGFVKPSITYTMDGQTHRLALFRYGDRYFFRDAGVGLTASRCSFNIRVEDLKACIEQADADPSPLGDILHIELLQDDRKVVPSVSRHAGMTLMDYIDEDREAEL